MGDGLQSARQEKASSRMHLISEAPEVKWIAKGWENREEQEV